MASQTMRAVMNFSITGTSKSHDVTVTTFKEITKKKKTKKKTIKHKIKTYYSIKN